MKKMLVLLFLFSFVFPQQADIVGKTSEWAGIIQGLLIGLVMLAAILSATAYVVAGFFGAETRARIQQWAQNLIAASFISLIVLAVLYLVMPDYMAGGVPSADLAGILLELIRLARDALFNLIVLLIIISVLVYAAGQLFGAETRARATVWSQATIAATIVAAIIYVLLFEIIPALFDVQLPVQGIDVYKPVIILTVLLMGIIVLITYLGARILRIPEWEAYLAVELSDLVTALLIVLFVVGLFSVSTEFANSLIKTFGLDVVGSAQSPPEAAAKILNSIIKDVEKARTDMYEIQMCTSILNTFYKRPGEAALSVIYKLFPGIDLFATMSGVVVGSLIMLEASLKAQLELIQMIDALTPVLLLPAGIVLRFFPPTKDAGSFLLAVAISLQIVFPLTYVINAKVFDEIGIVYHRPSGLIAMLCGVDFLAASIPSLLIPKIAGIFSTSLAGSLAAVINPLLSEGSLSAMKIIEYLAIIDYMATISLFGFFAPSISMVFTVAFINALTKLIIKRD